MAKIADLVSRTGLHSETTGGSGATTWVGIVASPAPTTVNDDLYVMIPDLSEDYVWGPCIWGGRMVPNLGDEVLIVFDNTQQPWAILGIADTSSGGGPSTGDLSFVYTQVSAAATWSVAHNLGKNPAVTVVDTGDNELLVDVVYVDLNNLTIKLASPTSGKAFMN